MFQEIPRHPNTTLTMTWVEGPSQDVLTSQDIPNTTWTPNGNPGHHSFISVQEFKTMVATIILSAALGPKFKLDL